MKFLTEKQFNEIITKVKNESFNEGYAKGRTDGYKNGYHAGLTEEKEGIYICNNGIYAFKDSELTNAIDVKLR